MVTGEGADRSTMRVIRVAAVVKSSTPDTKHAGADVVAYRRASLLLIPRRPSPGPVRRRWNSFRAASRSSMISWAISSGAGRL